MDVWVYLVFFYDQAYLILLCFALLLLIGVAYFTNVRQDPPPAEYDVLYCDTHFIMVLWNWNHSVSEVCLHLIYCSSLELNL